jgi:DNA polymerase-1
MYGMGTHSLAMDLKIPHSEAKQLLTNTSSVQCGRSFVEATKTSSQQVGRFDTARMSDDNKSTVAVRERAKAERIASIPSSQKVPPIS